MALITILAVTLYSFCSSLTNFKDGGYELNDIHLMKPSFIMEEDSENQMSKLSTDATGSDSSQDDSHIKGYNKH